MQCRRSNATLTSAPPQSNSSDAACSASACLSPTAFSHLEDRRAGNAAARRIPRACAHADGASAAPPHAAEADLNQLQTELSIAVAAEDYRAAAQLRTRIDAAYATVPDSAASNGAAAPAPPRSWAALGIPEWLADRAVRLGFPFPNTIQQRAAAALRLGADAVIRAETGSGKTLAFLLPALAMLDYPPALYPDDLKGPQAVIIVPHRELGVQVRVAAVVRSFPGNGGVGVAINASSACRRDLVGDGGVLSVVADLHHRTAQPRAASCRAASCPCVRRRVRTGPSLYVRPNCCLHTLCSALHNASAVPHVRQHHLNCAPPHT